MLLESIRKTIVEIIVERNKDDFLSYKEIAKRAGCAPSTVTALLKPAGQAGHRDFHDDWIERFCRALGIAPADLIKRAFKNLVAFTSIPNLKNGSGVVIQSEKERDLVLKLLDVLRTDPGGGGDAVAKNIEQFSALAHLRKESALKEAEEKKTRRL